MEALKLPLGVQPVTQGRVVCSEWTKLISLRSTRYALAATLLLAIGIGVLAITGEYSTGMIRSTMAAVPRRVAVLWGKAPLFLAAMGLFGLALGAILRSTAGGIAALAGIVFVLPPIVGLLPTSVANSVDPYLPSNAGGAILTINPDPGTLTPWAGFGIFCAYVVIAMAIAEALLVRRDA